MSFNFISEALAFSKQIFIKLEIQVVIAYIQSLMKIQSNVNSSKPLVKLIGLLNEISLNILKYVNIGLVYGVSQASQMSNMLVFYTLNK